MPHKVYLHYQEGDVSYHTTLKLTIPRRWEAQTCDKLKEFFVEYYNKKHPENALEPNCTHLQTRRGEDINEHDLVSQLSDRDDIYIKPGKPKFEDYIHRPVTEDTEAQLSLRCKNYGCAKLFREEENHSNACKHHVKPPLFHDLKKGWSCCPEKVVYDWDEFEKLEGCSTGHHSTEDPKEKFAPSPNALQPLSTSNLEVLNTRTNDEAAAMRTIEDFNKDNPAAPTAASAAAARKPTARRSDGTARCINFGCYKDYSLAANHPEACTHHTKSGVFHDAAKFWACCPNVKKYDFDEFMQIRGCVVTAHESSSETDSVPNHQDV